MAGLFCSSLFGLQLWAGPGVASFLQGLGFEASLEDQEATGSPMDDAV